MLTSSDKTYYRFFNLLFFFILVFSFLIKILVLEDFNTAFTSDQARDMLAIRAIVIDFDLPLLGPITGIPGLYLGPFWFIFNTVPFALTGGNPISLVIWQTFWFQLSAVILYLYLQKKNHIFAFTTSSLYLVSPISFYMARYSFNPHLLPAFTIFFLLLLDNHLNRPSLLKVFGLGIVTGLSLQLEAATAIVFIPLALIYLIKSKKSVFNFLLGLGVTVIPQLLFELRHRFLMTKVLFNQISGTTNVVGDNLTLIELFNDRIFNLVYLFDSTFDAHYYLVAVIFTISIIFFLKNKKKTNLDFFLNSSLLIFVFFFLLFCVYPHPIKTWYLYPLMLTLIFYVSFLIRKLPILSIILVITLTTFSFIDEYRYYLYYLTNPSSNPSNLKNRLQTLNIVYELSENKGFTVYNYTPSVYDYPYQYLFWWKGKDYGYHPTKISYQENVPEYIPNNDSFLTLKRSSENTFLIIEEKYPSEVKPWINDLNFCSKKTILLPWKTTIVEGDVCNSQ